LDASSGNSSRSPNGEQPTPVDALDGVIGATNEVEYWDYFASTVRRLQTEVETPSTVPADLGRALDTQHDMLADEPVTSSGVKETTNCEAVWPTALETYFADMRYFAEHYPYGWGATGAAPHECTFGSVQPVEPLVPLHRASYPTGLVVQQQDTDFDGSGRWPGR
jgi:hypothetical protein